MASCPGQARVAGHVLTPTAQLTGGKEKMLFKLEAQLEVADHDADLMSRILDVIMDRFRATAVTVNQLSVTKIS